MTAKRTGKALKAADVLEAQNAQAREAHALRLRGKSWWDIAEALGISERMAVLRVDEAISAAASLVDEHSKRQMLILEVNRLDALQDSFWGQAVGGDHRSAELVLKISAQRSKLLGLDDIGNGAMTLQTVIVQGTSAEYIAALQVASKPFVEG